MSAWAEAAYIIDQLQKSMGLAEQVLQIKNRIYIFDFPASGSTQNLSSGPASERWDDFDFSADSVWFVLQGTSPNEKVVGFSLLGVDSNTEELTWSSLIPFDVDVNTSTFNFDSEAIGDKEYLEEVTTIEEALNTLAEHMGESSFAGNFASTAEAGIVKIGNNVNINNTDGTISIPNASSATRGVVKLVNDLNGTATDAAVTQNAVTNAIANSVAKTTYVMVNNGNLSQVPNSNLYTTVVGGVSQNTNGYGNNPTVFLVGINNTTRPNSNQIKEYNTIKYIDYNNGTGELTLYSARNSISNPFRLCLQT